MKGYHKNIETETRENEDFRHVEYTGDYLQLVIMRLAPGEDIGVEVHGNDQFFRVEEGTGKVIIDDTEYNVSDGSAVIVPAGATHNVINTSDSDDLKLYTIYAPPHHQDGVKNRTKAAAEANETSFDGNTTE